MKLEDFLENKPLFYKEINRARMPNTFKFVQGAFKIPKIIHIIGTNGKGSTGRFLAQMLARNHSVGHYTSPHIFEFRERFWMNGAVASASEIETAH